MLIDKPLSTVKIKITGGARRQLRRLRIFSGPSNFFHSSLARTASESGTVPSCEDRLEVLVTRVAQVRVVCLLERVAGLYTGSPLAVPRNDTSFSVTARGLRLFLFTLGLVILDILAKMNKDLVEIILVVNLTAVDLVFMLVS